MDHIVKGWCEDLEAEVIALKKLRDPRHNAEARARLDGIGKLVAEMRASLGQNLSNVPCDTGTAKGEPRLAGTA